MNIKPLRNFLLVKRNDVEEKSSGGIILAPSEGEEKACTGFVQSVGSKVKDVKPLDEIYFGKFSGNDVAMKGDDYVLIKEEDVLAIIDKDQKC